MATSARKPARTASRSTRSRSKSSAQSSRSSRVSTSSSISRSRKTTTRTRSSAKVVRGRTQRVARPSMATRTPSRSSAVKKSRKSTVTRSSSTRRTSPKKQSGTAPIVRFFVTMFGLLLGGFLVLVVTWFFILPSVLLHGFQNENILLTTNNLDGNKGDIILAHFGSKEQDNRIFVIDGEEVVEVPNGYGQYAIGVVPALLSVDNQTPETMRSVMSRIMGVPVDAVVVTDPLVVEDDEAVSALETDGAEAFFFAPDISAALRGLVKKQMLRDPNQAIMLLRLSFLAKRQNTTKIELRSYQETSQLLSSEAAMDLSPEEQKCSIAVINTTQSSGLARDTAQLLESNGAYVVREDSVSDVLEKTQVQLEENVRPECQTLSEKLETFFPESLEMTPQTDETKRYRANIVIMLGLDVVTAHQE